MEKLSLIKENSFIQIDLKGFTIAMSKLTDSSDGCENTRFHLSSSPRNNKRHQIQPPTINFVQRRARTLSRRQTPPSAWVVKPREVWNGYVHFQHNTSYTSNLEEHFLKGFISLHRTRFILAKNTLNFFSIRIYITNNFC